MQEEKKKQKKNEIHEEISLLSSQTFDVILNLLYGWETSIFSLVFRDFLLLFFICCLGNFSSFKHQNSETREKKSRNPTAFQSDDENVESFVIALFYL